MMTSYEEDIALLIYRSLVDGLSEIDRKKLEVWVNASESNRLLFEKIKKEIRIFSEEDILRSLDEENAWQKFQIAVTKKKKRIFIRKIYGYAAAVVISLTVAVSLLFMDRADKSVVPIAENNVSILQENSYAILVTSDLSTYTLDNTQGQREIETGKGVVIRQNGGNLDYFSDDSQDISESLEMNTLKIPRGGEFQITLSDGTNIYLNSASELKYPVRFNSKERKVYLSGEAYFDVAKDDKRPFHVVTDNIRIRIYGTEFNVNTHKSGYVYTVLVNGKLGIRKQNSEKEIILRPGELASYNDQAGEIKVKKVDVEPYIIWKDGYFTFENETLEEILYTLSLWYNVDVFFQNEEAKKVVFTGYMKRYNDISDILDAIASVVKVNFRISGRTIIVSK